MILDLIIYVLNFLILAKTHTTEYFVNAFIKPVRLKQYIRTSQLLIQ